MKLGKLTLELQQPEDAEQQLVALTGCSRSELITVLGGQLLASTVAAALIPFVKDAPSQVDLARAIASSPDPDQVRLDVLALLQGSEDPEPQPKGATRGRRKR